MDTFTTTDIPVGESPERLAITPDGARLYVTHGVHASGGSFSDLAKTVSVIDTSTDTVIGSIQLEAHPNAIVMSPTGTRLFASHMFDDLVSVIDTTTDTLAATVPISGNPSLLCVTADGSRVYVTRAYEISVIDATTYEVTQVLQTYPMGFGGIAVASDGGRLYATGGSHGSNILMVIDLIATPPVSVDAIEMNSPQGVALSADGSRCYVIDQGDALSWKNDIVVVDTKIGVGINAILRRLPGDVTPKRMYEHIAVDPTGARIYVTDNSSQDKVWVIDAPSDTVVTSFPLSEQAQDVAVRSTDPTIRHIYVSHWPSDKVSHTVSTTSASLTSGELLSYGDAGTPGNVSDPVTVGFGG